MIGNEATEEIRHATDEFVTLCARTRTVRYEGEWISVESYLERRYGVRTSHGISPTGESLLEAQTEPSPLRVDDGAHRLHTPLTKPRRLAAVRATGLLESPTSDGFDRLTRIGAKLLGVPTTFISLVDEHRAFCAVDVVPRLWTESQVRNAVDMARLVVSEIELRQTLMDSRPAPV